MNEFDNKMMQRALALAKEAYDAGEIPVGAVITKGDRVIAEAANECERSFDATAHAELLALSRACKQLGTTRLPDCTLYVTMEPCPMCAGAVLHARVGRVVFAAKDAREGAFGSLINLPSYPLESRPEVESGICSDESLELLSSFFQKRRKK